MTGRMSGKRVMITGAAGGIGSAAARLMHAEGARLLLTDKRHDEVAALAGELNCSALGLDVTQERDWNAAASWVDDQWKGLDVLVNNAGMELVKRLDETSYEEWSRVMRVNVDSMYWGCKIMLPALTAAAAERRKLEGPRASSSIVNTSSVCGVLAFGDMAAYNASKAAVRHLSKSLAVEFGRANRGIRVNSVHPGSIETPMFNAGVDRWEAENFGGLGGREEIRRNIAARNPLNLIGDPKDIGYGMLYLASDEAAYVSGIELMIDGGWSAE